jgi:transketolase
VLRLIGSRKVPGIEASTGSLGHGVGIGAGLALAAQRDGSDARVAVIVSDGEMYEGSLWESTLFAAHQKLDNLVLVIDRNRTIILGDTETLLPLEPVAAKWAAFGFRVLNADGHDFASLLPALDAAFTPTGMPTVVIADTVKGKGVSFMENRPEWHYWQPVAPAQVETARRELA